MDVNGGQGECEEPRLSLVQVQSIKPERAGLGELYLKTSDSINLFGQGGRLIQALSVL